MLGLPFYYLLCFVGIAEESEAEIAGLCTMLGFAIHLLQFPKNIPGGRFLAAGGHLFHLRHVRAAGLARLQAHAARLHLHGGRQDCGRPLLSFRRALELDPANHLAHQGMDYLHSNIEIDKVDAGTLGLLDPIRCLEPVCACFWPASRPPSR